MPLFNVGIDLHATVYIRAPTEERALEIAAALENHSIEAKESWDERLPISELPFDHPDLPDVSLSPAMTVGTCDDFADECNEDC